MQGNRGLATGEPKAILRVGQKGTRSVTNRLIQDNVTAFISTTFDSIQVVTDSAGIGTSQCHINKLAKVPMLVIVNQICAWLSRIVAHKYHRPFLVLAITSCWNIRISAVSHRKENRLRIIKLVVTLGQQNVSAIDFLVDAEISISEPAPHAVTGTIGHGKGKCSNRELIKGSSPSRVGTGVVLGSCVKNIVTLIDGP